MARKPVETLDSLLAPHLDRERVGLTAWCEDRGINARTVYRLRNGVVGARGPNLGTLAMLAAALGVDVERVRAAIEASRVAAEE